MKNTTNYTPATTVEEAAALDRIDLIAQAQAEHEAVKAATKAGKPAPSTPALAYLNGDEYRARKANGNGKAKAKGEGRSAPTPVTKAGFVTVQMVKGRQVEVVAPIAAKVTDVDIEAWSMLVKPTAAQTLVDTIVDALIAEHKPYPTRMLTLTFVSARKAFPKATTTWTSPVSLLVSALNAGMDDGSVEAWGYDVNADSTLGMWFEPKGKARVSASIRDLNDRLGVKSPAKPKAAKPAKAAKATKASKAPAKAAAAKKAATLAAELASTGPDKAPAGKALAKALNPTRKASTSKKAAAPKTATAIGKQAAAAKAVANRRAAKQAS